MGTTADKLNKLEETKAAIKTAITNKGVEVSDSDTFASYADKINSIPTGGGSDKIDLIDNLSVTGVIDNFDFSKIDLSNRTETTRIIINALITLDNHTIDISSFDVSKFTELNNIVSDVSTTIQFYIDITGWNTTNATRIYAPFYADRCVKLIGELDTSNCTDVYCPIWGFADCFTLKNFGKNPALSRGFFSYSNYWGVDTHYNIEGSKQSLIDSLITYSFDRATAGYSVVPITLSSNTKGVLSEDEIAQITAKGFTIA